MSWRWAGASVVGTSHLSTGQRLQDAYSVSVVGADSLLAIVSDGAGSAKFGHFGAWLVCRCLKVALREHLKGTVSLPDDDAIHSMVDDLRARISKIAETRGANSRDFAATFSVAVATNEQLLTFQVGDCSVVALAGGKWDVVRWPDTGEYASTTFFVTDEPAPRLTIDRRYQVTEGLALFSDGIGELALTQSDKTAHAGFFDPVFRPVGSSLARGRLIDLSRKLADYLGGPTVCDRTGDDKTLILASRV